MSREVEFARQCVVSILNNNNAPTTEGLVEIINIKFGDNTVLLEHLKALVSIFQSAIEELEGENVSTSKTKV